MGIGLLNANTPSLRTCCVRQSNNYSLTNFAFVLTLFNSEPSKSLGYHGQGPNDYFEKLLIPPLAFIFSRSLRRFNYRQIHQSFASCLHQSTFFEKLELRERPKISTLSMVDPYLYGYVWIGSTISSWFHSISSLLIRDRHIFLLRHYQFVKWFVFSVLLWALRPRKLEIAKQIVVNLPRLFISKPSSARQRSDFAWYSNHGSERSPLHLSCCEDKV